MKTSINELGEYSLEQRCEIALDRQDLLDRILCTYLSAGRRDLLSIIKGCSASKSRRFGNIYQHGEAEIRSRLYSLLIRGLCLKTGSWWYIAPEDFCRADSYQVEEEEKDVFEHEHDSKELQPPKSPFGIWSRLQYPGCGCDDEDTHDTMHYLLRWIWIKLSDLITPSEINEVINEVLPAYEFPNLHREEVEALSIQRKLQISKKVAKKASKKRRNTEEKSAENNKKSVDIDL